MNLHTATSEASPSFGFRVGERRGEGRAGEGREKEFSNVSEVFIFLRFRFAYWMRTVNPGQLAAPGKNVPIFVFSCVMIPSKPRLQIGSALEKGVNWLAPTPPFREASIRTWSRATLKLTRYSVLH